MKLILAYPLNGKSQNTACKRKINLEIADN